LKLYGPFHRIQSAKLNDLVEKTGRIWGRPARNIFQTPFPAAKAWIGSLPEGAHGIEFFTPVEPSPSSTPKVALWYRGEPGVSEVDGEDAVWIPAVRMRRVD
jgi:hypothetical protein